MGRKPLSVILMVMFGNLGYQHPNPYSFYDIEDALKFIEEVIDNEVDAGMDRIVIYEVPKASYTRPGPIRGRILWQFSGEVWQDDSDDVFASYPQGKLLNHDLDYYSELVLYYSENPVPETNEVGEQVSAS